MCALPRDVRAAPGRSLPSVPGFQSHEPRLLFRVLGGNRLLDLLPWGWDRLGFLFKTREPSSRIFLLFPTF